MSEEFVTITSVPRTTGDFVKKGDIIIELETSKATHTIEADCDGYVRYFCEEGDDIEVNALIVQISDSPDTADEPVGDASADADQDDDDLADVMFSKSALALIEREQLDKDLFKDFDFVTLDDVKEMLSKHRR